MASVKDLAERYGVSEGEIKTYMDEFKNMDRDNDQFIDAGELQRALNQLGQPVTLAQAEKMVKIADSNDDGKVDLEEFLTVLIRTGKWKTQPNIEQEAMAAFQAFDVNNDGYISADELRNTMAKLGQTLTKKEAEQMLKAFDKNSDGKICYTEFLESYKSMLS